MTIKEAILQSLEDLQRPLIHAEVYEQIVKENYYNFGSAKTPKSTISALLGDFIRKEDTRIKRVKKEGGTFAYYLTKYENDINIEIPEIEESTKRIDKAYRERDLHILLSTYLNSKNIHSKTILHEQSKNSNDNHQKWIHPDMIGINFLNLQTKETKDFLKVINTSDTFKITSYEIKKEINTDYELKKTYFQAVSNSSWANYGYLVAFEINSGLMDEMERLNQSFGIGIIELKANPYESKTLFQAKYKELDFKTIDKLCKVNDNFKKFIVYVENILTANEKYVQGSQKELIGFCDNYFKNDTEIEEYCKDKNIPMTLED